MMKRRKTVPKQTGSVARDRNSRPKVVGASSLRKSASAAQAERRAEERLRKLNETLTVLFQFAPDAIVVVDQNGSIVRVNDQARAIFGYAAKEVLGKRIELL